MGAYAHAGLITPGIVKISVAGLKPTQSARALLTSMVQNVYRYSYL